MLEREQLVGNGGDLSVFLRGGGLLAVPPRLISFGKSDKYVCVCVQQIRAELAAFEVDASL